MELFFHGLGKILLTSAILVLVYMSVIVLGVRFGLFIWLLQQMLKLRQYYLNRKRKKKEMEKQSATAEHREDSSIKHD